MKSLLEKYLARIFEVMKRGDAREESYYSSLESLLLDFASAEKKKFDVTTLPKKTEAGNPDFRVWDGRSQIVGYIEAKDPSVKNLGDIESLEQLKRYRETFPNLILTNFFEFRLYRNGLLIKTISIARPFIIHELKTVPPVENEGEFENLLKQFTSFSVEKTTTAKQLATELAKRTRFLRDNVISEYLREGQIEGRQTLEQYYDAFRNHLIGSLTSQAFSDLFAQTITYGLFAARSRATNGFSRQTAFEYIPKTIGILRKVFQFVSSADIPKQMEWIVDDIADVLAATDVHKIIERFHRERRGRDPIIHFYETFLAEYDPAEREKRGVYYTPEPVVDYIVRSTQTLLKEKFEKQDGFASENVTVLDPAAGTLTFEAAAVREAAAEYEKKYGKGGIEKLLKGQILKNFYAFELMMAPYAVGHLKMGLVFDEYSSHLSDEERFKLFLTNTLEFEEEQPEGLPGVFERTIAEESREALKVKGKVPVMVVLGNPPYSGVSENASEKVINIKKGNPYYTETGEKKMATRDLKLKMKTFIGKLIEDYKMVDGVPLNERKHWLQDDYVKFYRFAQWKIEQAGQGILGFITNHAWLDNPTFRGMRRSLMNTFDGIYLLDLHGSTLKREKTPEGGKDENVFDIRPGVAIGIFVKLPESLPEGQKKIYHADQWGLREAKYEWLDGHDIVNTKWEVITPRAPFYFFVPKSGAGEEQYEKFWKVNEIFMKNSTGVLTGRDDFVIDFEKESLEVRINALVDTQKSDDFIKTLYNLKDKPAYKWFIAETRKMLQADPDRKRYFTKILYRPFDERWIYYHPELIFWPRTEIMQHMKYPNLAFMTMRQVSLDLPYSHFLATDKISEARSFMSAKGTMLYFPLYLYRSDIKQDTVFSGQKNLDLQGTQHTLREEDGKITNVNPEVFQKLERSFGKSIDAEELFFYIYGAVYAPMYRERYAEFLKSDFPRIPFTSDYKTFSAVAALGKKLVDLHLLRSEALDLPSVKFEGDGSGKIEERRYIEKERRLYVNAAQYFSGITPEVWNDHIGGYQVLDKWLKDRKGRTLSSEEIVHYCKVATVIMKTIEIQKELDKLYLEIEKNLIESD